MTSDQDAEKLVPERGEPRESNRQIYWKRRLERELKELGVEGLVQNTAERLADFEAKRHVDTLTGLMTLKGIKHRLGSEIARAMEINTPLSVLMLDLDGFKKINDTLGHAEGNKLIKMMADFLTTTLRRRDVIGRYGGDEFTVVLPDTNIDGAVTVGEKIRTGLIELMQLNNYPVTTSVGVTHMTGENRNVVTLLREADSALKDAKDAGKDQVIVYSPEGVKREAA